MKIVGGSATIMTKNDGSEQTAFIQNGTYLATIAITYTGQTGTDLGSEMNQIVQSFRWNK
jgi:hypothetical protein